MIKSVSLRSFKCSSINDVSEKYRILDGHPWKVSILPLIRRWVMIDDPFLDRRARISGPRIGSRIVLSIGENVRSSPTGSSPFLIKLGLWSWGCGGCRSFWRGCAQLCPRLHLAAPPPHLPPSSAPHLLLICLNAHVIHRWALVAN